MGTKSYKLLQYDSDAPNVPVILTITAAQIADLVPVTTDTGWTANSTSGDKTAVLSSYSNGLNGTMVTALNVVSANTGTALSAAMDIIVLLVKKVAAMETALAAGKLPDA